MSGRDRDSIFKLEKAHAMDGTTPSENENDPIVQAFIAHFKEWDARKCEALTLLGRTHPILQLRALLFRGRHKEASQLLKGLNSFDLDDKEFAEMLFQQARLAALEGNWALCIDIAESAGSAELHPTSKMALFQVEALAHFELGNLDQAQQLLERTESLGTYFKFSASRIYAVLLALKISARRRGTDSAFAQLDSLWAELKQSGSLDRNMIQALLRTEIDLCRLSGRPHARQAVAALLIAESMGEELYAALGLVDCYYAVPGEMSAEFERRARSETKEFPRIKAIFDEIQGKTETLSTSAEAIKIFEASGQKGESFPIPLATEVQSISFENRGIVLDLKSGQCFDLTAFPQLLQAVEMFGRQPIWEKEDFFHALWGNQKYAAHLHESLIFALQRRLKTKFHLKVKSQSSKVVMLGHFSVR